MLPPKAGPGILPNADSRISLLIRSFLEREVGEESPPVPLLSPEGGILSLSLSNAGETLKKKEGTLSMSPDPFFSFSDYIGSSSDESVVSGGASAFLALAAGFAVAGLAWIGAGRVILHSDTSDKFKKTPPSLLGADR